jgi:glycosyltransferase involved in cell wall biosynthesis
MPGLSFEAYGSGEMWPELWHAGIWPRGSVEWSERGNVFGDASALLVPSRFEPFGMVILEAMQHRVPVLYPRGAGAAEVLSSGIKIDPTDIEASAQALARLLNDRDYWAEVVLQQRQEIAEYPNRGYEERLQEMYRGLASAAAAA